MKGVVKKMSISADTSLNVFSSNYKINGSVIEKVNGNSTKQIFGK